MRRQDALGESPGTGAQRTITDLWSINMSSVRNAALQLPPPSSGRAAVSPDARQSIEFLCEPPAATGSGEARGRGGRAAQDDRVRKGGQKRRAPAVAGSKGKPKQRQLQTKHTEAEIDLDNSDGQAESEDIETAEDRGFIDPSSQDEHTGEHAAFDNSRQSEHTQRLAREEPEIQSEKKKTRSERRVLTALPERGMAEADRQVADYCYKAPYALPTPNRLVTPYWKQQGRELVNNQLVSGAFGSDQHRTWCNDKRGQSDFASLFCTPWKENIALRSVSTDLADTGIDPLACCTNSTAKLLHAIKISHKQTELDLINGKFIQHVFVGLQQTSRELALAMHSGPFGGMQGKADVVLWSIRHGDEVSNTNPDMLNLIELIRCTPARARASCHTSADLARLFGTSARACRARTATSCGRVSARSTQSPTSAGSAACSACRTGRRRCANTTITRPERAASRTRWTTWTRVSASVYGGIA